MRERIKGVSRRGWLAALCCTAWLGSGFAPAQAAPVGTGDDPNLECVGNTTGTLTATPATVALGQQSSTLRWNVQVPTGCNVTVTLDRQSVARQGSRTVQPTSDTSYTLRAAAGSATRTLATVRVSVQLPKDQYGRINVTITSNAQVGLFIQAISSDQSTNAIVNIQNHVSLDLSHRENIHLYPGVQILGGRSSTNPGPLLFTTTYPKRLFVIGQYVNTDNVRISGIRLRGADQTVADDDSASSTGIWIKSSLNVEIDNSEIYGWHTAAISVHDGDEDETPRNRIDRRNGRGAVRIHDNLLHHNQRIGLGYGVEVSGGAYALVEKNVFGHNRHAVSGDGSYGSGYFFYRNFVDTSGGHHGTNMTHQIDMHGQDDCWGADGYCGTAGEYMDVRHNAIAYTAGTALKLRGTPTQRMDVAHNWFAHSDMWGNWVVDHGAMEQTDGEGDINHWDNTFGGWSTRVDGACDFDRDGVDDNFVATGATWLFGRGTDYTGYRYLNTSSLLAGDLEFVDVDSDGICDVRVAADGRVSLGGRTSLERLARTDLLSRSASTGQLRISHLEGGVITGQAFHALAQDRDVVATGDFDGDGDSDILWRRKDVVPWPNGEGVGRPTGVLFLQDGVVATYGAWGISPVGGGVKGVADFDGNGTSDVLWRDESGRLKLWYWDVGSVDVSWRNEGWVVGADWDVKAVGDFDGDGYADIAWRHDNGQVALWHMVGNVFRFEVWPGVRTRA